MATNTAAPKRWTIADSLETYSIRQWGAGYFGINDKGNVMVHPGGPDTPSFDLKELIDEVRRKGTLLPADYFHSNWHIVPASAIGRLLKTP